MKLKKKKEAKNTRSWFQGVSRLVDSLKAYKRRNIASVITNKLVITVLVEDITKKILVVVDWISGLCVIQLNKCSGAVQPTNQNQDWECYKRLKCMLCQTNT